MELIRKCIRIAPVNRPTSPERQSTMAQSVAVGGRTNDLRKALTDAMKILDDRREKEKRRPVGHIIVISDSNDDSIRQKTLSSKYIIHAFGFRDTHNTMAMHYIASSSKGIYAILNDDRNQITEAFTACINNITSTIAIDTRVEIMCSHSSNVVLSTIESGQLTSSIPDDGKSGYILAGALYAGAVRNFIVYVGNVREDEYESLSKLFAGHVEWGHAESRDRVVSEGIDGSNEVLRGIARVEAVKIVREITDPDCGKKLVADKAVKIEGEITDASDDIEDKLYKMCLQGSNNARVAGEERLLSEMERMKANLLERMKANLLRDVMNMKMGRMKANLLEWIKANLLRDVTKMERMKAKLLRDVMKMEKNQRGEITDPNDYVRKLVADKLSYMLSWLSFQGLCEQPPSLP